MNDDVKEMLRATTILQYASFAYERAVAEGDRLAARNELRAMMEATNLVNLAQARMSRIVEKMPR